MTVYHRLMMLVAVVGCSHPDEPAFSDLQFVQRHATRSEPGDHPAPRLERPAMVRFHMERHFDDLHTIERLLVAGKLPEATTLAHMLTRPANDPGLAMWKDEAARVAAAASEVEHATTLDQALRREPRIAAACAACHERTRAHPMFTTAPVPPDRPSPAVRPEVEMARHQWAVDRLWEGMIGASEERWRAGLEILAADPLPVSQPDDAAHLQQLARAALARPPSSVADRATSYGDMLVACAGCHATRSALRVGRSAEHP